MTTVEQRNPPFNQEESLENNSNDSTNNNLSLPTIPTFDMNNPTPLSPLASLASLERCISNPLVRGYSNVSVSSDNEGAHFVPFGRGHDDIANPNSNINPNSNMIDLTSFGFGPNMVGFNGLNMTPTLFPNDNDRPSPLSPLQMYTGALPIQSNVMQQPINPNDNNNMPPLPVLAPLEDGDTDATSSQIASSDLPSSQTDNDPIENKNTFNAEAAEFVPTMNGNANVMLPQLIGLQNVCLPPLLQAVPIVNINNINNIGNLHNMSMLPRNLMPVHVPPPGVNNLNNMMPTAIAMAPIVLQPPQQQQRRAAPVRGSSNKQNSHRGYDQLVNNYMNATNHNENHSPPAPHRPRRGGPGAKYVRVDNQKKPHKNVQSMDVTEIIKMNLSLPALLENNMICKFMKHQNGSRYIQEKLKLASNDLITEILSHIIFKQKQILSLSEDIFGNYVIQIFFENGTPKQHILLIQNLLHRNVYRLARSFYGCRVIQKAFETIPKKECIALIRELEEEQNGNSGDDDYKSVIHECIICPNANHVVQKIITLNLEMSDIQFIIACIDRDICFYSSHIFGCRIVQNIINHYGYENNAKMLSEMACIDNLLHLCQSQYGNYVIQHILALSFASTDDSGFNCVQIKKKVICNVFSNVLYLSKNKYGSNVVEKCLQKANDKERDLLLDEILDSQHRKNKCVLVEMVRHKYANYVIQKLLVFCNIKQQQRLIYHIDRNIPNLRGSNYGKHIMEKIKKIKQSLNQNQYNY